jgi:Tripartite tricarboxylate transporter TctB family
MFPNVSSPKDFWAGLIYIGFGAAALWIGAEYKFGTAGRMGPGYVPKVLACLLLLVGAASLIRSFLAKGEPIGLIAWKPMIHILIACALFGVLLAPLGLIASLLALCLVSATGSRQFRFDVKAAAGLVVLIVFCALVFVRGLGVPMPLFGG